MDRRRKYKPVNRVMGRRRRAYLEIEKLNRRIEALLRFTPNDEQIQYQRDVVLRQHNKVRREVNDNIGPLLGRILDRDVYEKELQLLLDSLKEVAVEAAAVKDSHALYEERVRNEDFVMEMNEHLEIPKNTENSRKDRIYSEMSRVIAEFKALINYTPCSYIHHTRRNDCILMQQQEELLYLERIKNLQTTNPNDKTFEKKFQIILFGFTTTVDIAKNYRKLNDYSIATETPDQKMILKDRIDMANLTIDDIKMRFDSELELIENPVLPVLNELLKDARTPAEEKIAACREQTHRDIMTMDDENEVEANRKKYSDDLECELKKLQEKVQPYRDFQKEVLPIKNEFSNNCLTLISRADALKPLIINRECEVARDLYSKCAMTHCSTKIEESMMEYYNKDIDIQQLKAKHEELANELNEVIDKTKYLISIQWYESLHQKLEEIKTKLNTTIDFKTNDKSLSSSMTNLRVKFENASSAALRAFELKNLVAKTDSDYMEELLQPFTSLMQEAEDLRDKHGDALLSQMEQELDAKYKELKTKFHNTLDFECDDEDIIERRNELYFELLNASKAYLANDDDIDENELIAGSISDMVTEALEPFSVLVEDAEELRKEHEDTKDG